jgi:hypothetical protein
MNSNNPKNEKSTYDNLTNSIHYPLPKISNQHLIHDEYDNFPIIFNSPQNTLGNSYFINTSEFGCLFFCPRRTISPNQTFSKYSF